MIMRRAGVGIRLGKEGKWDGNEGGRGWTRLGKEGEWDAEGKRIGWGI